jgi:DNA end-binding protein Ku
MSARAIWKGILRAGRHDVPVKLYSAVEDHTVHFNMLDRKSRRRVTQRMVDPETGDEVDRDQIRRGYEVEPGTFVILKEAELEEIEPPESREIELIHFLPTGAIHHQWYERPYWLGPDGDAGNYHALAAALAKREKEALARWVMRKKEYFGALRAEGRHLVLITMRHADEVLLPKELSVRGAGKPSAREVKMAEQLISMLEGSFDPSEFHDEYNDRVLEFLTARAKGKRPKLARPTSRPESTSLDKDLARSVEAARKRHETKEAA